MRGVLVSGVAVLCGLSGACRSYDVPGRAEPFEACCEGAGLCVPESLAPAALSQQLALDSCQTGQLCAPRAFIESPGERPASCTTSGEREGRCLPSCLPDVAAQRERLAREDCAAGQLCVPCFDPLSGDDTEACRSGDDRPKQKPKPFAACCEGQGRCIPEAALPASVTQEDRERLSDDACEREALCVPDALLDDEGTFERCRAPGDLEGRCLPACLRQVADQAERLTQASCDEGQRCVPCFDPQTGSDSEACRSGKDHPREPARRFDDCCDGAGLCVPEELLLSSLSPTDRARFGRDACDAETHALCVPTRLLSEGPPRFSSCRAAGDLEGRCLPSCLPEVRERGEQLAQRDCDRDQRCVPCFDPLTGADSGACRAGDDQPLEEPRTFERCCGAAGAELGTCLPLELLSAQQIDALPVDSCRRAGTRCVPSELTREPQRLTECSAQILGTAPFQGLCLPECLVAFPARLFTPRGACGTARRCVPCASLGSAQPGCE